MKKLLFILFLFIFLINAKAIESNVRIEYIPNVYFNYYVGSTLKSGQLGYIYVNNEMVYCIDLNKGITSGIYEKNMDFASLNISNKLKEELEILAYYGYNNVNTYMAIQEVIWNKFGDNIFWTTGINGTGSSINVSSYKEDVLNYLNQYDTMPSFINDELSFDIGTIWSIIDFNNVLDSYEIDYTGNNDVFLMGNILAFNLKDVEDGMVTLNKKINNKGESYVYTKESSQRLIRLGTPKDISIEISFIVNGGSINLKTFSNDINDKTTLEDAIYGIYSDNNELIKEIKTDINGNVYFDMLSAGTYKIKQIKPSTGFATDNNEYFFDIIFGDLHKEIEIENHVIKEKLIINNSYSIKNESYPFEGMKFEIYEGDRLIDIINTDSNGNASIDLDYGKYLIVQKLDNSEYESIDNFEFVVDENNDNNVYNIINKKIIIEEETDESIDAGNNDDIEDDTDFDDEYIEDKVEHEEENNAQDIEKLPNLNSNILNIGIMFVCFIVLNLLFMKLKRYY